MLLNKKNGSNLIVIVQCINTYVHCINLQDVVSNNYLLVLYIEWVRGWIPFVLNDLGAPETDKFIN